MARIKLTRQEFYDRLWEKPMSSFMEKFGIGYSEMKKLITDYNIPVPPNGYWSQLRAGYTIQKTPFTESTKLGDLIDFTPREIKKRIKKQEVIQPSPKKLEDTEVDGHVAKARKVYSESAKGRDPKKLIKIAYESINLNVSPSIIERALSFMDALFKVVKASGGKIRVAPHSTLILMDGEEFFVALREKQNRTEQPDQRNSWINYDFSGSGILILKIGEQTWRSKEWSDTAYTRIEEKLDAILEGIREMAIKEKQDRADQKIRQMEWDATAKIKEDLEKLRTTELNGFIELKNNSIKWENAQRIRRFLDEMEARAQAERNLDDKLRTYLEWARKKADWYDPLVSADDELMGEVDKDSLTVVKKGFW